MTDNTDMRERAAVSLPLTDLTEIAPGQDGVYLADRLNLEWSDPDGGVHHLHALVHGNGSHGRLIQSPDYDPGDPHVRITDRTLLVFGQHAYRVHESPAGAVVDQDTGREVCHIGPLPALLPAPHASFVVAIGDETEGTR